MPRLPLFQRTADKEIMQLKAKIAELEANVHYLERTHNKFVGAILDLDEMEQDTDEIAEAGQDLVELARSSKVHGAPYEYRDLSGQNKIAELEKERDDLQTCFDSCYEELQATRDAHDELEKERDSLLQEAKIKNCELDTQSGIVKSICDLFDLRVKDYHCISKIKEALEARNLEQKSQCCYELISETKLHRINGDTYVLMRDVNNYGVSLGHQAKAMKDGE